MVSNLILKKLLCLLKKTLQSSTMKRNSQIDIDQSFINRLLLMYVINKTSPDTISHIQVLQKVPLLVVSNELRNYYSGFKYSFYMYFHGPISNEIYKDRDLLIDCDLIIADKSVEEDNNTKYFLTNKGKSLLKQVNPLLCKNETVLNTIDKWCNDFKGKNFEEVKALVYHEFVNKKRISSFQQSQSVITDQDLSNIQNTKISDRWIDMLLLEFSTTKQKDDDMKTFSDYQFDFLHV